LWKDLKLLPRKCAAHTHPIGGNGNGRQIFNEAAILVFLADEVAESVHATFHKSRVRFAKEAVMTDKDKADFNKAMRAAEQAVAMATIILEERTESTGELTQEDGECRSATAAEGEYGTHTHTNKSMPPAVVSTEADSKLTAASLVRTTRWPSKEDAVMYVLENAHCTPQQEEAELEGSGTPVSLARGTALGATEPDEPFVSAMHPGAPGAFGDNGIVASQADDPFVRVAEMKGNLGNSYLDEDDPMEFATQEYLEY
jgi:hypothetical protein